MFYDDEFEICVDEFMREFLCNWSCFLCKGFFIIFDGVKGWDMCEERSLLFFNFEEVVVVV